MAWAAACSPYVKDGKCVKIEGDVDDPITKGRLCVRCLRVLDLIYHPDRIVHPMVPRPEGPRRRRRVEDRHVGLGVRQDRGRDQQVQGEVRPQQRAVLTGTGARPGAT